MASLSLKGVEKIYPNGFKAVQNFNLDIADKEFIIFVGPSGCGKSTTLRMIAGLEDISAGTLEIDGKVVNDVEPKDRDIAMVFQNYALYPHMTVYENMAFGLKLRKLPKDEIDKKVRNAASILGLEALLDRKPKALSGGQRQRVAMGRAIVRNPKVFLMDEPLSNLDAKLREEMRYEIKEITKKLKITVIYVTHDQIEAMTMSDKIVLINKGEVQQVGTPQEIYSRPANVFVANFVGKVDFMKGKVENGNILLNNSNGQTLPNTSSHTKDVIVAIRPENVILAEDGELTGKVFSKFYLGDCNDLRVEVGNGNILRVTARASTYDTLKVGEEVRLKVLEYFVFEDDGKDQTKIMT